jgi:hypothetical protein
MVDQILAAMRRARLKLQVPSGVARCQAALCESVFPRLLHRAPPLNRDQLIMLQEDNVGNGRAADQLFGLKPIPFREGIAGYLR